jgi:hypothetical protein
VTGRDAVQGSLEREIARLASERTALYGRSGTSGGLSHEDQRRLQTIEREIDERFVSLRQLRAVRDVNRFGREDPFVRRVVRADGAAQRPPKPHRA